MSLIQTTCSKPPNIYVIISRGNALMFTLPIHDGFRIIQKNIARFCLLNDTGPDSLLPLQPLQLTSNVGHNDAKPWINIYKICILRFFWLSCRRLPLFSFHRSRSYQWSSCSSLLAIASLMSLEQLLGGLPRFLFSGGTQSQTFLGYLSFCMRWKWP